MGFLTKIKSLFIPPSVGDKPKTSVKKTFSKVNQRECYSPVKKPLYKIVSTKNLEAKEVSGWDSFFSSDKKNDTLPGFEKRSRRKFRHLFHNENLIIAEATGIYEIISKENVKQISLKGTDFEKMNPVVSSEKGIVLNKDKTVVFIDLSSFKATVFEFQLNPFTFAMGNDFWLVGTREGYEGQGELYSFNMNGLQNWGIAFKEVIPSAFGEIPFTAYLLSVSDDTSEIFVGSMDRLYRIHPEDASLKARIAISELKQQDIKKKYDELERSLSIPPKTEDEAISQLANRFAAQFTMGMDKMFVNSPFVGFTHDTTSGTIFIMEREGRVSAWDRVGNLLWINTFKNQGRFIDWVDEKLAISFQEGETFWLDKDGKFVFGAKLPKEASTIRLIPDQLSYLVVSQDNRLYELEKETGHLIKGAEGHPGMELFVISNHSIFFDGKERAQGYFWLSPENHQWQHFQAVTVDEASGDNLYEGVAPEIAAIKSFKKAWEIKSGDDWFGGRLLDIPNNRIYVVEKAPRATSEDYFKMTDAQRRKDQASHYLVCYDTSKQEIWRQHLYSGMWTLYLSPDGEYIFTSVPKNEEIIYLPGDIVVFNKDGKQVHKFKSAHHGYQLEFLSNEKAVVRFSIEKGEKPLNGYFVKGEQGKWTLLLDESDDMKEDKPFGAGLDKGKTAHFELVRTDKKKYTLSSGEKSIELKLQAAIYDLDETVDGNLALRIGTRLIHLYNQDLEKIVEIKEAENIQSVKLSPHTIVVLTKKEIRGYSHNGQLLWRYSSIPKAYNSNVYWSSSDKKWIWVVSSNIEAIVATISEDGKILNSQSFDKKDYHRPVECFPSQSCFVAQTNGVIQAYQL